jgi:lipopolysaccharide biosynthesis regulator YciM
MGDYATLLAGLIALLAGLTIGKAWERYKLHDGRWFDRRKARETPHYMLGLNFLVANQVDLAIEELSRAAAADADALEIDLILGNLYREKGQVGRAIQIHQGLLQRPKLKRLEHAYSLLCLGLDYKSGGFVDRAVEAFNEVLRLDAENEYALVNLEKLYEEQHQWQEAYDTRRRLTRTADSASQARHNATLAFLENELGLEALNQQDLKTAAERFTAAIELDAATVPAYLHLGDVYISQGRQIEAASVWERSVAVAPDRAHLAFDRLESVYSALGTPERFPNLCRRLVAAAPQDWRARLALASHLTTNGKPAEAIGLLFEALTGNPHGLAVHQAIWKTFRQLGLDAALVDRYVALAGRAIFYLDPHVCMHCRYRSTELLWHCPHCHEWNSFVEERIAAAKDGDEVGG